MGTPLEGDFIVVVGSADSRIATLATAQHGRVAWWQLREAGISQAEVRSRVAAGWLIRVRHGVYAVGHLAPADHAREVEALLCAPPGTLLSHLTASRLWKLHDDPRAERAVDILVPSPAGQRRAHVRVHRTVVTSRLHTARVDRLPLTTPAQTLADIAGLLSVRELERALDEALARRLASRVDVERALDPRGPQRGIATLRRLLERRAPLTITRSHAEERFLALVRDAELPLPELNVRLHGFTVDFYWRDAGLVVEVDGYQWHSTRSAFERDRRKEATLRRHGLELMRITVERIRDHPAAVAAQVAAGTLRRAAFTGS